MKRLTCLGLIFSISACGASGRPNGDGSTSSDLSHGDGDVALITDGGGGNVSPDVIYAHSSSTLYTMDPTTLAVTIVAPFQWPPSGVDQMTDVAVNKDGKLVGVSFFAVYAIEPSTAKCQMLSTFNGAGTNGLSFIPLDNGDEVLVASSQAGALFRIDPTTGTSTSVGSYGSGISSSGDLVSVTGLGTFATVRTSQSSTDWIAKIDPTTGAATLVGDTMTSAIWGLGFWKDKLYGFSSGGQVMEISPTTGATTMLASQSVGWYGAGVKTSAPVIQ